MTLTLPYSEIKYVSNGVIDTYSFSSFSLQNLNQLLVDIYDVSGNLVNPALYPYDANITDPTSDLPENSIVFSDDIPPENYIIILSRLTEQTQEVSFSTLGGYNSKTLENILSKIVQMIQESSYKLDHEVPALNPLQTDWIFDRLLTNNSMLYIDTINKVIKQTSFPKENVVQATGGMYLRRVLQNGYYIIEYSMDNITWTPILSGGAADYHNNLLGRDVANAHPASAITGVAEHIADTNNPHNVTKAQVGLGNVDNTSDADKPISTAAATALGLKVDKVAGKELSTNDLTDELKGYYDTAYSHSQTTGNPHGTTKSDVGLGNVDNTSDADKPISDDTQDALDDKADLSGASFSGNITAPNIIAGNTIYGGTVSDNLDTITKNGFYTCYGTATGVPSASYAWFVLHQNSNVGTTAATQRAVAYDSSTLRVYERVKTSSTWGDWNLQGSGSGGSAILPSGTCSTAGATAAKEVSVSGYTETAGACALITFANKNSALGPNLYIPFTGETAADPMGIYTLTTIGSPTYTDDKFNSNGTTGLAYNIASLGTGSFCIQGLFRSTNTSTAQTFFGSNNYYGFMVFKDTTNKLIMNLSGNNTSWNIVGGATGTKSDWATDTDYYIRFRFNGSNYYVDWSTDGLSWTNDITYTSSTPIYGTITNVRFGIIYNDTNPLIGTMDDLYVTIGSATTTDYPTLNINGGGAKYLCHEDGTRINPANPAYFIANCPIQICYDGTGYRFKREVVKTYVNGVNWYNLRNDGWVEQGGRSDGTSSISFPITMINTNFYWVAQIQNSSNFYNLSATVNTTGFTSCVELFGTHAASATHSYWSTTAIWQVKGYAA